MALFSWMFPPPADGRQYVPRNPTGAVLSFRATPGENDVASSSILGVSVVLYPYEVQNPYKSRHRSRSPAAGPTG